MNIINLSSPFDLDPEIIAYTNSIAECYDRYGDKGPYRGFSLRDLMDRIPVFLVNKTTLKEKESTDPLGFYCHEEKILGKSTPVIGLCLEKIYETIQGCKDVSSAVMADLMIEFNVGVVPSKFHHHQ
jgi:hypothetical protein